MKKLRYYITLDAYEPHYQKIKQHIDKIENNKNYKSIDEVIKACELLNKLNTDEMKITIHALKNPQDTTLQTTVLQFTKFKTYNIIDKTQYETPLEKSDLPYLYTTYERIRTDNYINFVSDCYHKTNIKDPFDAKTTLERINEESEYLPTVYHIKNNLITKTLPTKGNYKGQLNTTYDDTITLLIKYIENYPNTEIIDTKPQITYISDETLYPLIKQLLILMNDKCLWQESYENITTTIESRCK